MLTQESPGCQLALAVAALTTAAAASCSPGDEYTWVTSDLAPVSSTPAPFTDRYEIALVDDDIACVTNSFEFQVLCHARKGEVLAAFGREGDGPGEFSIPPALSRAPGGTLATFSEDRLTVFETDGRMVSETRLPVTFPQLAGPVGTTVFAQYARRGVDMTPVEIDFATGEVVWERHGINDIGRTECGRMSLGVASPNGGWTFPACQSELVFLEHRDDASATVIRSPTYSDELPNKRDIAEVEELSARYVWYDVVSYQATPKRNHLRRRPLAYDRRGRLWVATQRDRATFSYFDIFDEGMEHVGSVRIRDRILAYDLYGSTLAALVERTPDADGIARLATDWYDIGRLDFN